MKIQSPSLIGLVNFAGAKAKDFILENLTADPSSPAAGQVWFNQTDGRFRGNKDGAIVTLAHDEELQTAVTAIKNAVGLTSNLATTSGASVQSMLDTLSTDVTANALAADTAVNLRLMKSGDTMTGQLTMNADILVATGSQIKVVDKPTVASDLANKAYVDQVANGLHWKEKVRTSNIVGSGSTAPVSPSLYDAFLVIGGTGTLSSFSDGALIEWNGTTWADLGLSSVNDRFGVAFTSSVSPTGLFSSKAEQIATLTEVTGTTFTFTFEAAADQDAVSVLDPQSLLFGRSFTWSEQDLNWMEFQGPSSITAGVGISYTGSVLNVNLGAGISSASDFVNIDTSSAGGLFLTVDGSTESTDAAAQLALKLSGTSLKTTTDGVEVDTTWGDANYLSLANGGTVAGNASLAGNVDINSEEGLFTVNCGSMIVSAPAEFNGDSIDFGDYDGGIVTAVTFRPDTTVNVSSGLTVFDGTYVEFGNADRSEGATAKNVQFNQDVTTTFIGVTACERAPTDSFDVTNKTYVDGVVNDSLGVVSAQVQNGQIIAPFSAGGALEIDISSRMFDYNSVFVYDNAGNVIIPENINVNTTSRVLTVTVTSDTPLTISVVGTAAVV